MKFAKKWSAVAAVGMLLPLSSQAALTQQQYQNLVYGGAAAVAWGSVGTINTLLSYFIGNKIPPSAATWGNVAGNVCGAIAAGVGKAWNPATDPISKTNIALGVLKAGQVIGASSVCRWSTAGIAFAAIDAHNHADDNAKKLSDPKKAELNRLVQAFETQKGNLTDALLDAEHADSHLDAAQKAYNDGNCNSHTSLFCSYAFQTLVRAQRDARNSKTYAQQVSWDIGQILYKISQLEGETLPKPTAARPNQIP